jgi:RimJ/RimL family protein N-acetyltransferase
MDMNTDIYRGDLVRLAAIDPEESAVAISRFSRDSEFYRLMDSYPCRLFTKEGTKKWIEKDLENEHVIIFAIRTLTDDRIIGDVGLDGLYWNHGDTFLGIGVGDREFWGKGYGSDAMKLVLRYAFSELNMRRVTLNVFEYNPRAVRCYEKIGFQHEGRVRKYLNREGRRWDLMYMGITKEEWLAIITSHQNL